MIKIEIAYKDKKHVIWHPEKYNELTGKQLISISKLFLMPSVPLNERTADRISLLQELASINTGKYVKTKWFKIIDSMVEEGILEELLKLQGFLYEEQVFNNWVIKEIAIDGEVFAGPLSRFSYIKFGEFISADMLFMGYFDTKNEKVLDRFIAVLFRKKLQHKLVGDVREDFESASLDNRSVIMSKLDPEVKQAITFNYAGVRHWLADKYKFVFSGSTDNHPGRIEFGSSNKSTWLNIRKHLAGDVFNLDRVDNLLMHDVLDDLNDKMSK